MTVEGIDRRGKKVLRTLWVSLDLNICRCLQTEAMLDGQDSPNNQITEKISIREEFFLTCGFRGFIVQSPVHAMRKSIKVGLAEQKRFISFNSQEEDGG